MAPPAGHLGLRLQLGRVFHDQQIKIGFGAGVARGPGAERASFRKYDMLSQRWRPWARLYPGVELLVGLGELLLLQATALALLVGNAVFVDHLALNCACVGGNSKTPSAW